MDKTTWFHLVIRSISYVVIFRPLDSSTSKYVLPFLYPSTTLEEDNNIVAKNLMERDVRGVFVYTNQVVYTIGNYGPCKVRQDNEMIVRME